MGSQPFTHGDTSPGSYFQAPVSHGQVVSWQKRAIGRGRSVGREPDFLSAAPRSCPLRSAGVSRRNSPMLRGRGVGFLQGLWFLSGE